MPFPDMFKSMEKDFKSPVSTIPPRGQVVDIIDEINRRTVVFGASTETNQTQNVGTDAQNPAQDYRAIPMAALSPEFRSEFWSKVDRGGDCWEWTGYTANGGYGRLRLKGDRAHFRAHRIAYAIAFERDPGELVVCHKCDNPSCCRPAHLFLGTHKDNSDDKIAKGRARTGDFSGERNPRALLTEEDVKGIIRLILAGKTNKEISDKCSVGHSMVSRIRLGHSWRHVSREMGYVPRPGKTAPKSGRTGFKRR